MVVGGTDQAVGSCRIFEVGNKEADTSRLISEAALGMSAIGGISMLSAAFLGDTPRHSLRRMQHHKFESTTRMLFNPSNEKEEAGMLLFKDEKHQYLLAVNKQTKKRLPKWQL